MPVNARPGFPFVVLSGTPSVISVTGVQLTVGFFREITSVPFLGSFTIYATAAPSNSSTEPVPL